MRGPLPSVGRPGRTTIERQGVVDGALGPANDARDGSAAQIQLTLLLERWMDKKESAQHQVEMIVGLLPG